MTTDELTPAQERHLYATDRAAWRRRKAGVLAAKLMAMTDAVLATSWERVPRETQIAVWQHLDEAQRERVRRVREGQGSA